MLLGRARECAANNAERPRLGNCHSDLPLSRAAKPENADTTPSNRSQRVTAQTAKQPYENQLIATVVGFDYSLLLANYNTTRGPKATC
jgi:hypothetical protein